MGRSYWSDVIRTSRTLARLIWIHVPFRTSGTDTVQDERVMDEKKMALQLVEG